MAYYYNFYKELNKTYESTSVITRWRDYRHEVTQIIESILETKGLSDVVVIGYGQGNDLDIKALLPYIGSLTITDIDDEGMKNSIESIFHAPMHIEGVDKIQIAAMDYLGIDGLINERDLLDLLMKKNTEQLLNIYRKGISQQSMQHKLSQYDLVVCMPIHTQLVLMPLLKTCYNLVMEGIMSEEDYGNIQRELLDFMPEIIRSFNMELRRLMNTDGTIVLFADLIEDGINGEAQQWYNKDRNLDPYHEAYIEAYGMGLGAYGLYEMTEYMKSADEGWLRWPITPERVIFVKYQVFE